MICPTCGSELDASGNCARCGTSSSPAAPVAAHAPFPSGDPFLPGTSAIHENRWKAPLFAVLALVFFAVVIGLNYLRALHWAGTINPESFGYMIGGVLTSLLLGLLVMFLAQKARGKKAAPASKVLGVVSVALLLSIFTFSGEVGWPRGRIESDAYHQAGNLLKEAAGKQPAGKDANWWDAPSREFFQDILQMNQAYSAEVAALDSSAIKDLYSSSSYGGEVHMQKVVSQLQTALAVDEKYASLDPIITKMEERVEAQHVSEGEKRAFLKGMKASMEKSLLPRNELIRSEEVWMKSTIALYQFVIVHMDDYSIRDNKLYFRDDALRKEFTSQQSNAIALHQDFLKAKRAFDESRKSKLNEMGVAPSDLTPSQLGKVK